VKQTQVQARRAKPTKRRPAADAPTLNAKLAKLWFGGEEK